MSIDPLAGELTTAKRRAGPGILVDDIWAERDRILSVIEAIPVGFCLYDRDDRLVLLNETYRKVYPKHADLLQIGRRFEDMLREGVERGEFAEAAGCEEEWIRRRVDQHRNPSGPIEQCLTDGRWLRIEERRTRHGGIVGLRTDITALKRSEAERRKSEERFRDFADAAGDWLWEMDADLRFIYMSENVERIVGVPPEWHYGKTREDLLGKKHDAEVWDQHLRDLREHRPFRDFEYLRAGPNGETKWLRASGKPTFDDKGNFTGYRGCGADITRQKCDQERLRLSQDQFHQAQKMDAIGQLTGGIAHDFNNLMQVIMGNAELLATTRKYDEEAVNAIIEATERGAELTRRLLAYSRQQTLAPKAVDVGQLVGSMSAFLSRSLGGTIEMSITSSADLWTAHADPHQIETALLNLALNARDAMRAGGELSICCRNARLDAEYVGENPEAVIGDHVLISVADTGDGMTEEIRAHAVEPFFTTKEVGEGSGLGLSMVYGFARQSGGHMTIQSAPGAGSVVSLYLPKADPNAVEMEPASEASLTTGRGEVILVLEDDPDVRSMAEKLLLSMNYIVLQAASAKEAKRLLDRRHDIDLVLSDVILPGGQSGPEFAAEIAGRYPKLKIAFMSGYLDQAGRQARSLTEGHPLLEKPFQVQILAKTLRSVLDGARPNRSDLQSA